VLVLLLTVATFTVVIFGLGVSTSGRIYLVNPEAPIACGDYLGLAGVLCLLQAAACAALGSVLLPVVGVQLAWSEIIVLGLFGGSLLFVYLLNAALNAYGAVVGAAAIDALGSVGQVVAVALLVARGTHAVNPYLGALLVGNALQAAFALAALRRTTTSLRPRRHVRAWRLLIRKGVPGIGMDLAQILTFRLDRYLIGIFMTPAAVGVYSVAATAPEMLRLPVLALTQPIFHRLASGAAQIRDFERTQRIALFLTGALAAVVFVAAPLAVRIAFGPDYSAAVTPLRILLLAEFGITIYSLDASSLAGGLQRVGDAALAAIIGLLAVVIGDLILIPPFDLPGAAWASVLAYSLTSVAAHALLRRRLRPAPAPPPASS
jgi:O-antigen/teichoic acid export membrane protein